MIIGAKMRGKMFAVAVGKFQVMGCYMCASYPEPHPDLLQWHHVYPEDKVANISEMYGWDRAVMTMEFTKVIPLCEPHHNKYHTHLSEYHTKIFQRGLRQANRAGYNCEIPWLVMGQLGVLHSNYSIMRINSIEEYEHKLSELRRKAGQYMNNEKARLLDMPCQERMLMIHSYS
jgi:hypothetical protein